MNKVVRVTGLVQPDPATSSFQIRVNDLTQFLVMKNQADAKQAARADLTASQNVRVPFGERSDREMAEGA
jgi:hypothetical protein